MCRELQDLTVTKVDFYKLQESTARLNKFEELHAYTMNLPTRDNLANQMGEIISKHHNLNDLVLKNYVTINDMQIHVEENSNYLKQVLISKIDYDEYNRQIRFSMDNVFEKQEVMNVKLKDF
jgi:hypothetical protein